MKRPKLEDYEGTIGLHKNPRVNMLAKYSVDLEEYCDELEEGISKWEESYRNLQKENELLKEQLLQASTEINELQVLKKENEELKSLLKQTTDDLASYKCDYNVLEKALEIAIEEATAMGNCSWSGDFCKGRHCDECFREMAIRLAKDKLEGD